ncbi:hypothetical protein [Alkalibacillus silvisoli]|uniref:GtrA-like protein domain-containing protein n=1 Tax=Alkalibacillus silvisoli TaxID=392823 RepID=A0ABN0ZPA2_9BACI
MDLLTRFLTAVVSAFVFSVIISLLSSESSEYWVMFFSVMSFSLLVYLTAGILFSYLGDYLIGKVPLRQKWAKYIVGVLVYTIGGVSVNIYLLNQTLFYGFSDTAVTMLYYGIFAAVLFCHIKLFVRFLLVRLGF